MAYFIGLMSGTSMDGVDAAIVDIDPAENTLVPIHSLSSPYSQTLKLKLDTLLAADEKFSVHEIATVDAEIADAFADAALAVLTQSALSKDSIVAIGSHGQTIRHGTSYVPAYTYQLGNGARVAAKTDIPVVSDFRSYDVAKGGEGAPLAPAFHEWFFSKPGTKRALLNLGGIANLSILPFDENTPLRGFDTGPANCLLDEWCTKHTGQAFDRNGAWAAGGTPIPRLLEMMLADPYFALPIPKSTGREYFNLDWLNALLKNSKTHNASSQDIQASLAQLTVRSIASHIERYCADAKDLIICGGGTNNTHLLEQIQNSLPGLQVSASDAFGLNPNMLESYAFAWLAHCRWHEVPVTLTTKPGDERKAILGSLHLA